jgi:hypothetical protein
VRSYLHCPTCARAYDVEQHPSCPRCPRAAAAAPAKANRDAVADIVIAATQLARAIARATPAERLAARASLHLVREQIGTILDRPRPRILRPQLVAAAVVSLLGWI